MTERQVEPVNLPSLSATSELPEESAVFPAMSHNPIVQSETMRVPPPPPVIMENVSPLPASNSGIDIGVAPVQEPAQVVEIVPSPILDDNVTETRALPVQEAPEVIEIAPFLTADNDAVSVGAPSIQEVTEVVEMPSSPLNNISAGNGNIGASHVQEAAHAEAPRALLVTVAEEELPPPSFLTFYGLSQQPFDVTPDPAYLYLSRVHREALTSLSQGIENLRGFMALVAEPGMGKTTLLNKLMEELSDSTRIVFLFQTQCNSSELFHYLLSELGIDHDGMDVVTMHRTLNQILFREMLQGRRFVLIIDEAQNLQDSVLETIRLLSDFETTHSKLIQIVLAGQPQLVETLMRPALLQLRQRVAVLANLEPLGITETAEYIHHRLRAAGRRDEPLFTPEALELIAERSEGIPRSINNLCFNALVLGYSQRQEIIDSETVRRVAAKLDLELLVRRPQQDMWPSVSLPHQPLTTAHHNSHVCC